MLSNVTSNTLSVNRNIQLEKLLTEVFQRMITGTTAIKKITPTDDDELPVVVTDAAHQVQEVADNV